MPWLLSHFSWLLDAGYPDPASLPFSTQTNPVGLSDTLALSFLRSNPPVPDSFHPFTGM